MNSLFYHIGIIVTFIVAFYLIIFLASLLWRQWLKINKRVWVYQVYEWIKIKREWDKKDFSKFDFDDWRNVEKNIILMQGRYKGLEWRARNIFAKKYIAYFSGIMKSKEFDDFKNHPDNYYYTSLEEEIEKQKQILERLKAS